MSFNRSVWHALLRQLEDQHTEHFKLCQKVALLTAAGYNAREIAGRLSLEAEVVKACLESLERAAPYMDHALDLEAV